MNAPSDPLDCSLKAGRKANDQGDSLLLSVLLRIEETCIRFEAAWKAGQKLNIEDVLGDVPDQARPRLFRELLGLELALHENDGEMAGLNDYLQRFPDRKELVVDEFRERNAASVFPDHREAVMDEFGEQNVASFLDRFDVGDVLGDYEIHKKLGHGGMGEVYKAQKGQEPVVAIKVLFERWTRNKAYIERFKREARLMMKLDHPNVLRCFGFGQHNDICFLVMEYAKVVSLEKLLKKLGSFSIGDALYIILKTAKGLQHAHEKSVIHRDIKPDNIFLTRDGIIKLADLGLAKDTGEDFKLTNTGTEGGTAIYMPLEQARNFKGADARSDIYALGVMLYVFLTGQPPFQGNTLVDIIRAKEKGTFAPMHMFNHQVPKRLELIVAKMLAKRPENRFSNCADLIADLTSLRLANDHLSFFAPAAVTIS
jgi:serine/threonine protein kinase